MNWQHMDTQWTAYLESLIAWTAHIIAVHCFPPGIRWWGNLSKDAQMLQPLLLLQLVGITHAAAPVNRLPPVTHDALDRLHIHISSACGPKVVHHLCMLRCNVFLPQTPGHRLCCILHHWHWHNFQGGCSSVRMSSVKLIVADEQSPAKQALLLCSCIAKAVVCSEGREQQQNY